MRASTVLMYVVARIEVALGARILKQPVPPAADELAPSDVPSISQGDTRNRILAEIDQEGRYFASDPRDKKLFNTTDVAHPRRHHAISIVWNEDGIRVQKRWLPTRGGSLSERLLRALAFDFYVESASLLRLRGFVHAPTIRQIDTRKRSIEMDYIWGHDIRHEIRATTEAQSCAEIDGVFRNRITAPDNPFGKEVRKLLDAIIQRGVLPRDVHAANFIRGRNSGRLYMVDYNVVHFRPLPGWR